MYQLTAKKAYDMGALTWMIVSQRMCKISDKISKFITGVMKNWKEDLTSAGKTLHALKIQRDMFQGDWVSPLLFVIKMTPVNYILRKCTGG